MTDEVTRRFKNSRIGEVTELTAFVSPMSQSMSLSQIHFMFVTSLSEVVLSPHLVWRFGGTIGISHIPGCFGNLLKLQ